MTASDPLRNRRHVPPPLPPAAREKPAGFWIGIGVGGMLLVALGLVGLYFILASDNPPESSDEIAAKPSKRRETTAPAAPREFESPIENARREAAESSKKISQPRRATLAPIVPVVETPVEQPKTAPVPWDRSIKSLGGFLALPSRPQTIGGPRAEAVTLTRIHASDPKAIDLTIHSDKGSSQDIGREGSRQEGFVLQVEDRETDSGDRSRRWIVARKVIHPITGTADFHSVGTFTLANETLTFHWDPEAPEWTRPRSLGYCLLEIRRGTASALVQLSRPQIVDARPLGLRSRVSRLTLEIPSNTIGAPEDLSLDLSLTGVGTDSFSHAGLAVGESATFKTSDGLVELELAFQFDEDKGPFLEISAFTRREVLTEPEGKVRNVKGPAELANVARYRDSAHTIPIQTLSLPTSIADFKKIADQAEKNKRALETSKTLTQIQQRDLPANDRLIALLRADLQNPMINSARSKLDAALKNREALVQVADAYRKRIQLMEDQVLWCKQMQEYFEDLARTARVGYSIYYTLGGAKIRLVETAPEPSLGTPPLP